VKTTLLVALDTIRALLHQRLLLGLMLIALALIAIFSIVLLGYNKATAQAFVAQRAPNPQPDGSVTSTATEGPVHVTVTSQISGDAKAKSPANRPDSLTPEQRRKLQEQLDQTSSVFQGFFYQVGSFGGSLVALFIFSTAVASEIRRGTIRITLTKPVSRPEYLLGKYLGGIAVMAAYALIASVAMVLFARFGKFELGPAMTFAPWLMFCRQLMLGALALLLSLFFHPFLASVLAFFAGNGLYSHTNPLFYLFPSYSPFNAFTSLLSGTLIDGKEVLLLTAYAADFVVLMLLLALWRFRSKELI
jgi:ABC-type transport system involved in multi-copper enzyme maturation permease subunit